LAAGSYAFRAHYNGNANYNESTSDCEPLTVNPAASSVVTTIHNASHAAITTATPGDTVHDKATVTGIQGFTPTGTVDFTFFTGGDCTTGTSAAAGTVSLDANGVAHPSTAEGPLAAGSYAFRAHYNGDTNYAASTSACEPLSVFQTGKTMGYWGNQNGQKKINDNGGYSANAVAIGRGSNIDSKEESLKVLPNTLNACGKGTPFIFVVGAQTAKADCTLATGINKASLNTLAAQTLALGYNLKPNLRPGFAGQTLGQLQCSAGTTGLNSGSTVEQAFAAAVVLINGSASGGSTTQPQIGAMNQLLGCLNRES
jgi:hypothetical protein